MAIDILSAAARFYDLSPDSPMDIGFYQDRLPSPNTSLLELGCGTGRILVPLARLCTCIHGIDLSEAMISICRRKMAGAHLSPSNAQVQVGDITAVRLGRTFDLITAPFRVLQISKQTNRSMGYSRRSERISHRACILKVFDPNRDAETMRNEWADDTEYLDWEIPIEEGRVTCHVKKVRLQPDPLVIYPDLIYRRFQGDTMTEEAILPIVMRCYYPQEFQALITSYGFRILDCWGGYSGEAWGRFRAGYSVRGK